MAKASATSSDELANVIERAREAARDFYRLTGKPLGMTGEIGEYETARLLNLKLAAAREPGYDAIDDNGKKYQIKSRSIPRSSQRKGGMIGSIKLDHQWDAVLLLLLDEELRPQEIWQAERPAVAAALTAPGSKARNERGALAVSKFKSIGQKVWPNS